MPFTELLIFHLILDHLQRKKIMPEVKAQMFAWARQASSAGEAARTITSHPQAGMRAAAQGPGKSSASSESDRRYDSPKWDFSPPNEAPTLSRHQHLVHLFSTRTPIRTKTVPEPSFRLRGLPHTCSAVQPPQTPGLTTAAAPPAPGRARTAGGTEPTHSRACPGRAAALLPRPPRAPSGAGRCHPRGAAGGTRHVRCPPHPPSHSGAAQPGACALTAWGGGCGAGSRQPAPGSGPALRGHAPARRPGRPRQRGPRPHEAARAEPPPAPLTGSPLVVAPPLLWLGHGRSGARLGSARLLGPSVGLGLSAPPRPGIRDNQPMEEQDRFLFQRLCEADFSGRGSGGDWRRQAKDELAAMAEIPVKARERSRCIFLLSDTRG